MRIKRWLIKLTLTALTMIARGAGFAGSVVLHGVMEEKTYRDPAKALVKFLENEPGVLAADEVKILSNHYPGIFAHREK